VALGSVLVMWLVPVEPVATVPLAFGAVTVK
jgi:hypothetical protein